MAHEFASGDTARSSWFASTRFLCPQKFKDASCTLVSGAAMLGAIAMFIRREVYREVFGIVDRDDVSDVCTE
jgi:hypothetical protein